MNQKPKSGTMSRRHFVTLVAAGSAALLAPPAGAAAPARPHAARPAAAKPASLSATTTKELNRQRASTLDTLKVLRDHPMPAGTELGLVFHARIQPKKGR